MPAPCPCCDELAREAGLNHNTFYRHFDNPGQLQAELLAILVAGTKALHPSAKAMSQSAHKKGR